MNRLTAEQIDQIVANAVKRVISDLDLERIVQEVLDKALIKIKADLIPEVTEGVYNNFYAQVGKVFIYRVLWAVGICFVTSALWFVGTRHLLVPEPK